MASVKKLTICSMIIATTVVCYNEKKRHGCAAQKAGISAVRCMERPGFAVVYFDGQAI
jgi:hypothetical protein